MLIRGLACGLLAALPMVACGGNPSLPDQGECPPLEMQDTDDSTDSAYRVAVFRGLSAINTLDDNFRDAWPERRLRERQEFREDFALYAHLTTCWTEQLLGLDSPGAHLDDYHNTLHAFAERVASAMDEGVDAVARRNRSQYEDWVDTADAIDREGLQLAQDLSARTRQ